MLVDGVRVAGCQRLAVGEGDLDLACRALGLDRLDRGAGVAQDVLQVVEEVRQLHGMVEGVVEVVRCHRLQSAVPGRVCLLRGAPVEHELTLQTYRHVQTEIREAADLGAQHGAGRDVDRKTAAVQGVGVDENRVRHVRQAADGA